MFSQSQSCRLVTDWFGGLLLVLDFTMVYGIGYALSVLKVSLLSFAAPASNTYSLLAEIGSYALRVPEPWQPSVYPLLGTNDCGNASFAGNTSFAICDPDDVRNNRVVQFDIGISVVSDVFTTKANGNACTQRNESETNLDIAIAFLKSVSTRYELFAVKQVGR